MASALTLASAVSSGLAFAHASALTGVLALQTSAGALSTARAFGPAAAKTGKTVFQAMEAVFRGAAKTGETVAEATQKIQVSAAFQSGAFAAGIASALATSSAFTTTKMSADTAQLALQRRQEIATEVPAFASGAFTAHIAGAFVGWGLMGRTRHPSRSDQQESSFHG